MHLSKPLPKDATGRDFLDMDRYHRHQPSVLNMYFGINLIRVAPLLPPLSAKVSAESQERQEHIEVSPPGLQLNHATMAVHHQVDRISQDTEVNQYVITNGLLGRGAYGIVKVCKDGLKSYAIKIFWLDKLRKKYFLKEKELSRMINMEVDMLMKLKHPNIIEFKEMVYAKDRERVFIVMQLCKGETLSGIVNSHLTAEQSEWEKILRSYFKQLVEAVSYSMHRLNVIHRDIKPENVMIGERDVVKLIDFNISQEIKEETIRVTKFIGTRNYAAPELLLDVKEEKSVLGKAVDIWALGMTFLQIVQRKHPFNARNVEQLQKCLREEVKIEQEVSGELADLLRKMLHLHHAKRINIQEVKAHPWMHGK